MYTLEHLYEIWNDSTSECIEIGPDRDGLDLIEIRAKDDTGKLFSSITMTKEQAVLVTQAIIHLTKQEAHEDRNKS